jgi:anti-anti-sigma factor
MKSLGESLGTSAFTERFGAGKIGLRSFSDVRFDIDCSGAVCLLHVDGEIDIYSSPELEAKIADLGREQPGEILVSFLHCSYIDCSGLRILLRQFKQLGNRLLIVAPRRVRSAVSSMSPAWRRFSRSTRVYAKPTSPSRPMSRGSLSDTRYRPDFGKNQAEQPPRLGVRALRTRFAQ